MARKILIVDNDRLLREQLKDALEQVGHEVFVAADGLEGLELNRRVRPDVILLDIVLPKLDGLRLCRYLREDPEFRELPIIAVSGIGAQQLEQVLQAGATATVAKESMAQLLPKLTHLIENVLKTGPVGEEKKFPDPTPRTEILRELMAERSHFVELMDVLPEGFIELDSAHRIHYANREACKLLNQEERAVMGKFFGELFPPELKLRINTLLKNVILGSTVREIIQMENRSVRISFAPVTSATLYSGAAILLQDATAEISRIEELNRQNRQLVHMKQELERRFNAVQIIQRLSAEIPYPYGHSEIFEAILSFLPDLIPLEVSAALMETGEAHRLHIYVKEDVGQENINWVKSHIFEQYRSTLGQLIDPSRVLYHLIGVNLSPGGFSPARMNSWLYSPVRMEDRVIGIVGCFSCSPSAFSQFDQQLLEMFIQLTLGAVVDLRNMVEVERKKMQAMVESMADGVLMTDQNDEILVMNQAAKKILRVSRREDSITKKYFQDTLGFYPFRLTRGLVHKAGLQATIKEEIKVFDKTLHSVVSPVYDGEGVQTGTVVVLRDITEQKELEERKNDFLSVISHELRTPLASIGGSIDLVLDNVVGEINEKQQRYLELARDSCQKLNVVIDDLLDISKFEKGRMEINMEPISIVQLVEEVAEKFQVPAMEKDILIKLQKPAQDAKIYGDYNRLVQVMNNLLSNAIKFTPAQGEIEIKIFTPKVLSPHIGISVKDTGPGIRTEDLERVFDKFEQVRRSDTRKIGGTGLGLAISRGIIEAHKGKIWAESHPGEGAKFIFLLPVEKRTTFAPEIYAELGAGFAAEEVSALIIAADADTAYLIKGILVERGMKVTVSYTAQEGFGLIRQKAPSLIIIDTYADPSLGVQLIEILTGTPETGSIPIICLSRSDTSLLLPYPTVNHVQKPIEMNQFLSALSSSMLKIRAEDTRRKILLIDDDENMRMICKEALLYQNFAVIEASNGTQGLEQLKNQRPDLILLDIMMPGLDGFQFAQIVKSNISTYHIPIIFLTAKGQTEDKVKALKSGGSDYLVKPFDATELAARIEAILERTESELSASPTTKLPGSIMIEREINDLISQQRKFALCYLDVDNLKAYNDEYGYAKADSVIKQTGEVIRETVLKLGEPKDFVGHIAGDDFVFITHPDRADTICLTVIESFDQIIPFFYNQQDRERGYIEGQDRYGVWRKFPILSVSIVCLTNEIHHLTSHLEIATVAAEYKRMAKAITGSVYIRNGKTITIRPRPV